MIVYNGESIRGGTFELRSLDIDNRKSNKNKIFMSKLSNKLSNLFQGEQRYVEIVNIIQSEDRIINLNPIHLAYAIYVFVEIIEPEIRNKREKFELNKEIIDSSIELIREKESDVKDVKGEGFKITIVRYIRFILKIYTKR
jgi:hypothetical protein